MKLSLPCLLLALYSSFSSANVPMSYVCGNHYVQLYTNANMELDGASLDNATTKNVGMNREVIDGLAHTQVSFIFKNKKMGVLDYREDGLTTLQLGKVIMDVPMPDEKGKIPCRIPLGDQ